MSAFDKVIGYEDIKTELYRICDVMKDPGKYRAMGVTTPRGVLIHGVPGIGKTLMANCLIEESGRKAFVIRKDRSDGDFVNTIRETFEKAKNEEPSIVFLDDLDKFANEDERHRDADEYVTVQSCIDDCRGREVFVVATVNDRYCLPVSLIRPGRFDKEIYMDNPDEDDAVRIIEHILKNKPVVGDVDAVEIARLLNGRSCATLEAVINEAGIYAAYGGKARIGHSDIVRACMRVIFNAPESTDKSMTEEQIGVAVHEAGHAVVSELLDPGSVSLVSICRYNGATDGVIVIKKNRMLNLSKELMENNTVVCLGGKAATEVVSGKIDVGSSSDLQSAFCRVYDFVDRFCSYGFDAYVGSDDPSQYLLEKRDRLIASELERYYQTAKRLIISNRPFFDRLLDELMKKQTLTCRDIERIRKGCAA